MFMATSIEYLGHQIDKDGLHPTDKKVTCIKQASTIDHYRVKGIRGVVNLLWEIYP